MSSQIVKKCENSNCDVELKIGDKVILHNDLVANWYFCCDECYCEWLEEYAVKKVIIYNGN